MRIQFYSLNLGRHLHQKEEALCFVYVLKSVRHCVPTDEYQGRRRCCSDDRRMLTTYPDWLIACQSSPRLTHLGVMFSPSLSISWSHSAKIKEKLQRRSRNESKRGSSLFLPLRLSSFPDSSSNSSDEPSEVTPVRAKLYPLSPFLLLYFAKTPFRRLLAGAKGGAGEKSWNGRGC